jgi:hypothetical protein
MSNPIVSLLTGDGNQEWTVRGKVEFARNGKRLTLRCGLIDCVGKQGRLND